MLPRQVMGTDAFYIYVRVSSKEQEREGYSLPAQLDLLRDYAKRNRLTVAREFVEAESAKEAGRPRFNEMLALLRGGKAKGALFEKIDRFSRNFRDWADAGDLVQKHDKELHFVKEDIVYTRDSNPDDIFMVDINVSIGRRFINNLRRETSKGMRQKALAGIYPSRAPYGYLNENKALVPDPETAPLITRLFDEAATGRYNFESLGDFARSIGLTNRRGTRLARQTLHRLMANPLYAGRVVWSDINVPGTHEPLVTAKTFGAVQQAMTGRRKQAKHDFAFRGMMTCGECGSKITAEVQKGYVYYRCTKRRGPCSQPYAREGKLIAEFGRIIAGIHFDAELLDLMLEWAAESVKNEVEHERETRTALEKKKTRISKMCDGLVDKYIAGNIPDDIYKRKLTELRLEEQRLDEAIHAASEDRWLVLEGFELVVKATDYLVEGYNALSLHDKAVLVGIIGSNWVMQDKMIKSYLMSEPWKTLSSLEKPEIEEWYPQGDSNPCRRRERAVS